MSGAHDPYYIEFIARLRNARKAKRLSQSDMGKLMKRNQAFVSKVETCERRLDVVESVAWCIALGIKLDDALPPDLKTALDRASSEEAGGKHHRTGVSRT